MTTHRIPFKKIFCQPKLKKSFFFASHKEKLILFSLLFCFSPIEPISLPGKPSPSLKDYHGLTLNFFKEGSGRRYLKVSYKEAVSENKKLGFLTMNLAFLKINDLNIEVFAQHLECSEIVSLFDQVSKQRGVRYAVAEPLRLMLQTPEKRISVSGQKGKFSSNGSLRIWGQVDVIQGKDSKKMESLILTADTSVNALLLTAGKDPKPFLTVPLFKQP